MGLRLSRIFYLSTLIVLIAVGTRLPGAAVASEAPYRSPLDAAFSPDGKILAVSDQTAGEALLIRTRQGQLESKISLYGDPYGLCWSPDGTKFYVAEYGAGTVAEINASKGTVIRRLSVGLYPRGLALVPNENLLLAANSATHTVSVVDVKKGHERKRIEVARAPFSIAVNEARAHALVTNNLPAGRANSNMYAPVVSVLNLENLEIDNEMRLPPGSTGVRDIAVGADGRWGYAVHTVGRTGVPLTQFERGWVMTHALSVFDLKTDELYATVLLDNLTRGAADPWDLACSPDGKRLWVTLSGTHELARIDLARLHSYMKGGLPDDHPITQKRNNPKGGENVWLQIKLDQSYRRDLVNRLSSLYTANLIERRSLPGNGPRGLALSPEVGRLAVAEYFSGRILLVKPGTGKVTARIAPQPNPEPGKVRRGKIAFHDATACFQQWASCASCHPNGARVDALNWDLPNDGVGNPKNLKSLLTSHRTPPTTWRGVRPGMATSAKAGFHFLQRRPGPDRYSALVAYLRSLEPQRSPHRRPNDRLTKAAKKGKKLFHSEKVGCASCHPAPLFTDQERHDVGTKAPYDQHSSFDTPSLIEVYRTAPYLHDGSAARLRDVLTKENPDDQHGRTSHLSDRKINDLVQYMLSLDRVGGQEIPRAHTVQEE